MISEVFIQLLFSFTILQNIYSCSTGESMKTLLHFWMFTLRKSPNTEFFLVRIFLSSDWIQENTDRKKTPYLDTFHLVLQTLAI